jgi:hypothetical protein
MMVPGSAAAAGQAKTKPAPSATNPEKTRKEPKRKRKIMDEIMQELSCLVNRFPYDACHIVAVQAPK